MRALSRVDLRERNGAMRWTNEETLPEDARAAMRDVLAEGLREAARKDDPGDGYMILLTVGKVLAKGGWKLQASFVEDERMSPKPFVVVHAYQDSMSTRGSVSADVVRTAEDRRYLSRKRLESMVQRRDKLNVAIDKLKDELDGAST